MKKLIGTAVAVIFCTMLSAAEAPFVFKDIEMKLTPTPTPKFTNTSSKIKNSTNNRWLRIVTTFIPSHDKKLAQESWYDDVTVEGTLVLNRYVGNKAGGYIVLTGKTRYFTIAADAKEHTSYFYVPPKLLERYGGNRAVEQMLYAARIAFYGPGRVLLGEGYWMVDSSGRNGSFVGSGNTKPVRAAATIIKEVDKNYSDVMVLQGGLYSKEKTPWQHADYDFYDLVYDSSLLQNGGSIKK